MCKQPLLCAWRLWSQCKRGTRVELYHLHSKIDWLDRYNSKNRSPLECSIKFKVVKESWDPSFDTCLLYNILFNTCILFHCIDTWHKPIFYHWIFQLLLFFIIKLSENEFLVQTPLHTFLITLRCVHSRITEEYTFGSLCTFTCKHRQKLMFSSHHCLHPFKNSLTQYYWQCTVLSFHLSSISSICLLF